jgi:hypothetical protein
MTRPPISKMRIPAVVMAEYGEPRQRVFLRNARQLAKRSVASSRTQVEFSVRQIFKAISLVMQPPHPNGSLWKPFSPETHGSSFSVARSLYLYIAYRLPVPGVNHQAATVFGATPVFPEFFQNCLAFVYQWCLAAPQDLHALLPSIELPSGLRGP